MYVRAVRTVRAVCAVYAMLVNLLRHAAPVGCGPRRTDRRAGWRFGMEKRRDTGRQSWSGARMDGRMDGCKGKQITV
ncbi:uncharacterized protein IWZ02DRAFT_457470 [Phyllosticta citriasiana]|uniref:uncharacterized protein n=1 Tax=Phyllosticta citriasiana TaxID=595635 RepID=UPI0030FDA3C0